jgi:hypothetical protein
VNGIRHRKQLTEWLRKKDVEPEIAERVFSYLDVFSERWSPLNAASNGFLDEMRAQGVITHPLASVRKA